MKGISVVWIILVIMTAKPVSVIAQAEEIQQLVLNYEKLAQLKGILENMKKGYEVLNKGYNTVRDISSGNFKLHDVFLKSLMEINPLVKNYKKVADIIRYQARIVQEYKTAYNGFKKDKAFAPDELGYLGMVYTNLLNKSLENIDELVMVVTASKLRMSDAERLQAIDRIYKDIENKFFFLRDFNGKMERLASGRDRMTKENSQTKKVYGLNN